MSQVEFNVKKRLENSVSHNVFISLILIPLVLGIQVLAQPLGFLIQPWSQWLFRNIFFLFIFIWVFGLFFGFLYPVIPFNSGILKGTILSFFLIPICSFLFFNSSTLDFVLGFVTLLLYGIVISTDFNGFTPLWGTDFLIKDYIILTGVVAIIVLALIASPFLIGVQKYMVIHFNIKRCIGCQFCVQVCPRGCYEFDKDTNKAILLQSNLCLKCQACELNCEGNALRIEKPIFQGFFSQLI